MNEPWKKDSNDKYLDTIRSVIGLSTASLVLPVFFSRNFLGIPSDTPLSCILGQSIYWAWGLLSLSILSGIFFQYLSAKWVRIAWGKPAGIFWSSDTNPNRVELLMEVGFWLCILGFLSGVALTVYFFTTVDF